MLSSVCLHRAHVFNDSRVPSFATIEARRASEDGRTEGKERVTTTGVRFEAGEEVPFIIVELNVLSYDSSNRPT